MESKAPNRRVLAVIPSLDRVRPPLLADLRRFDLRSDLLV
jgi:hypothetical protein